MGRGVHRGARQAGGAERGHVERRRVEQLLHLPQALERGHRAASAASAAASAAALAAALAAAIVAASAAVPSALAVGAAASTNAAEGIGELHARLRYRGDVGEI